MSQVTRLFVEKKPGFDVEASQTLWDLRHNLGLKALTALRLVNRYDISGLTGEQLDKATVTVFSEPNQDNVYKETLPVENDWKVFAMEYLPGQYDQRADSAAQQHYMINPVESRLASMDKPETLDMPVTVPEKVADVEGFIEFNDQQMADYYGSMGFAMTLSDLKFCRDYFRDEEKRNPTVTELRVIDTYWSDHCRHTTFLTRLEKIEIEKGALTSVIESALKEYYDARDEVYGKDTDRDVSLMDMALAGMKLLRKRGLIPDLDVSEEINACSIEVPVTIDGVTEQWLVQFGYLLGRCYS